MSCGNEVVAVLISFENALGLLKMGHRLTRKTWIRDGRGVYIGLQNPSRSLRITSPYIYVDTSELESDSEDEPKATRFPWSPSQTDVLADDWAIHGSL